MNSYTYDGTNHRISEDSGGAINATQIYYSSQWQDIEEDINAGGPAVHAQYVWSPVYTNALLFRDYDFLMNGALSLSERGYALYDANYNVTAIVTQHTINGDFNEDGNVDIQDLNRVTSYWQAHLSGGDAVGDFDHDGQISTTLLTLNSVTSHRQATGNSATLVVTLRMVYDPYGNFQTYNGSWVSNTNYLGMNITFQGGRQDGVTGNIHFDMRDYNPRTYTWNTQDPLGYVDGMNDYLPEGGNTINRVDPEGTSITIVGPSWFAQSVTDMLNEICPWE